jgi:transposase
VISTDATGALVQPTKDKKDGQAEACKKGPFFTAVVDCDAVLFAYVEHHSSDSVKGLFGGIRAIYAADEAVARAPAAETARHFASSTCGPW